MRDKQHTCQSAAMEVTMLAVYYILIYLTMMTLLFATNLPLYGYGVLGGVLFILTRDGFPLKPHHPERSFSRRESILWYSGALICGGLGFAYTRIVDVGGFLPALTAVAFGIGTWATIFICICDCLYTLGKQEREQMPNKALDPTSG